MDRPGIYRVARAGLRHSRAPPRGAALSFGGVQVSTSRLAKPLGHRAYGHIGHLPGSRMGPGDHQVALGQARICLERPRDRHDRILVSEKLDGSNCAVAKLAGEVIPLVRAGYPARSSRFRQHHWFADWVAEHAGRFDAVLAEGERLVGEWLAQAHGTRYALPHEPFVVFDLMTGHTRLPYDAFRARVAGRFIVPRLLHDGGARGLEQVQAGLAHGSGHGARDPVEGAVWRVERRGVVDFLAKWVRPDKVDGQYLPAISGAAPVWNWVPPGAPHDGDVLP